MCIKFVVLDGLLNIKMIYFVLLLILGASAQENVDIICPLPGNPSSVTQQECDPYTACEFTNNICHMKSNTEASYIVTSSPVDTGRGFYVSLEKASPANTLFGADIRNLTLEVIYHEDYHVQFKVYDPANNRYEVPFPLNLPSQQGVNPLYTLTTSGIGQPLTLNIIRNSSGKNILNLVGPLTFEDQFLQITYQLPSYYMYGIGENAHSSLKRHFDSRQTTALFSRDQPPPTNDQNLNLYSTHPYYINIEDDDGNTHSVLFYNSNAMEFSTFQLGLEPALTIRTIGGILDFHVFMGPTPEDVNVQYINTIGKPFFPPYWSLGFHLSRAGYSNSSGYRTVYDRMRAAQIPWDTQTFDIEYMINFHDFTYDPVNFPDFPALIQMLHDSNMKVVLSQDPALIVDWDNYPPSYRGREDDIFIKWSDASLVPADQPVGAMDYMVGYVWPYDKVVFADYLNPNTTAWWANELNIFHNVTNFDGAWLDMNEPSNFGTNLDRPFNYPAELPDWSLKCPNNSIENPPYGGYATFSGFNECKRISDKTLCMSAIQSNEERTFSEYDVHSLYGHSQSIATNIALGQTVFPGKRTFTYGRSSFPGTGQYVAHWLGDNSADWPYLRMSLIGVMEFNMFGLPVVGPDICGFFGEPTEELCIRFMQAGAFFTFNRNHNTDKTADQDPAKPGWDLCPVYSRDVLLIKYKYLPYLYALLHQAHLTGNTVVRPLFNAFTSDFTAREIYDQFMWGTGIMVAPVVEEGAISRDIYFPQGNWYDLITGVLETSIPGMKNIQAPLDKIPLYVRGGSILPFQEPSVTTVESRLNPFGLTVALASDFTAAGEVFWDDGISEHVDETAETFLGLLTFAQNTLSLVVQNNPAVAAGLMLETVQVYGFSFAPTEIDVNGVPASPASWTFDAGINVLTFTLSVPLSQNLTVVFVN